MTETTTKPEPTKPNPGPLKQANLTPKRFKLADYERNLWVATPEAGTTLEDVLKNDYFAHVAGNFKPFDKVEVRAEDESYYAELLVRSAGKNWAVCNVLMHVDLAPKSDAVPDEDYTVGWGGPHQKHRVVRKKDGEVLFQGGASADEARSWLTNHLKAIGR